MRDSPTSVLDALRHAPSSEGVLGPALFLSFTHEFGPDGRPSDAVCDQFALEVHGTLKSSAVPCPARLHTRTMRARQCLGVHSPRVSVAAEACQEPAARPSVVARFLINEQIGRIVATQDAAHLSRPKSPYLVRAWFLACIFRSENLAMRRSSDSRNHVAQYHLGAAAWTVRSVSRISVHLQQCGRFVRVRPKAAYFRARMRSTSFMRALDLAIASCVAMTV